MKAAMQNLRGTMTNKKPDMVNHPPHYNFGLHETIDVIEAWDLPYHLGNVVKYVSRAKRKGKELEDLKKAAWYLDRYITMLEKDGLTSEQLRDSITFLGNLEDKRNSLLNEITEHQILIANKKNVANFLEQNGLIVSSQNDDDEGVHPV